MNGEPVLTAARMKAFEEAGAPPGDGLWTLMRRAGRGAAERIAIRAGDRPILVLTGPGNNGGDGYVAAACLREFGREVSVASALEVGSELARRALGEWDAPVESAEDARPAPLLVDAVLGSGQSRPLSDDLAATIAKFAKYADLKIALDLVSGTGCDDGADLGAPYFADETLVFAALKPAHLLQPAAARAGRLTLVDIGLGTPDSDLRRNAAPKALSFPATAHKYDRGSVLVAAGEMVGASWLTAHAAQRAGAGYVTVTGETDDFPPSSLVTKKIDEIDAGRIDSAVAGPGLGRGDRSRELLNRMIQLEKPVVLDGDVFSLLKAEDVPERAVLTPHEGEFGRMFADLSGSKVERARAAAAQTGAVICLKGRDTVVAAPDGRAVINDHAHGRLGTAGSGDVLAGILAAELARGRAPFEAACAAVWRHGDASIRARDGMIAEDLFDLIR